MITVSHTVISIPCTYYLPTPLPPPPPSQPHPTPPIGTSATTTDNANEWEKIETQTTRTKRKKERKKAHTQCCVCVCVCAIECAFFSALFSILWHTGSDYTCNVIILLNFFFYQTHNSIPYRSVLCTHSIHFKFPLGPPPLSPPSLCPPLPMLMMIMGQWSLHLIK